MNICITSASGVEAVTKRELENLGYGEVAFINGTGTVKGDFKDVCTLNLCLKTAGRIEVELGIFPCSDFDVLYDECAKLEYENFLDKNAKIIVNAKSVSSKLYALSSIQRIAKKSICDRLERVYGCKISETGARYEIIVSIYKDNARVLLNTSGESLHKRGYRTLVGEAPLKETLANAIVQLSVWRGDRVLVDPFCGSGTILIEAVRNALNIPAGINRDFDFLHWQSSDLSVFESIKSELESKIIINSGLKVYGFDIDPEQIKLAKYHAKKAGVAGNIEFITGDMRDYKSKLSRGVIITNPPYGERISDRRGVIKLYKDFSKMFFSLNDWSAYVLTSVTDFENLFGKKCKKRKLYNGNLECNLYVYLPKKPKKQ